MFYKIRTFILSFIEKVREPKKLLGRWSLDYCPRKIERKIDQSNEDHCGPCGYTSPKYHCKTISIPTIPPKKV